MTFKHRRTLALAFTLAAASTSFVSTLTPPRNIGRKQVHRPGVPTATQPSVSATPHTVLPQAKYSSPSLSKGAFSDDCHCFIGLLLTARRKEIGFLRQAVTMSIAYDVNKLDNMNHDIHR